jgi:hypothetical protein
MALEIVKFYVKLITFVGEHFPIDSKYLFEWTWYLLH